MSRRYTAKFSGVSVAALQDLFEVVGGTGKVTYVLGWSLSQTTELGDAAEEILRVATVRGSGTVTGGSGGSSVTPRPITRGDTAFGGTVEANNTTRLAVGTGTLEELEEFGWNVRIPWVHYYTPETVPEVKAGEYWTLSLPAAPADALTVSGFLYLEEIG